MSFVRFGSLSDLPPGGRKSLRIGLRRIVVFNIEGALYALEDACAHMKAPLSNGRLRGAELTCTWHGWAYDVTTGRRTGRGRGCVRTFPIKVESGAVLVDPAAPVPPARAGSEDGDDESPALP